MRMHWVAERVGEANPPLRMVVPCYLSVAEHEVSERLGIYLCGIGIA
jgi:hypothetical protein